MMLQLRTKRVEGQGGLSRRQAIATLVGAPAAVLGVSQEGQSLLRPQEAISLCTIGIPLSWQLYFEGGLAEVENLLPRYIAQLAALIKMLPVQQKLVASLLSQGYQLSSLLALQRQNFGAAHKSARQALEYGEVAQDPHLQTASLIRQAQVYFYLKRPVQRLQVYQRALSLLHETSPLLRGRVYIGLTESYAQLGHAYEAQDYLDQAHAVYPQQCEIDPHFSYTHFNRWSLSSFEGLMHLHLKKPKVSSALYEQISTVIPVTPVPNRVELSVRQAEAAIAAGDRERSCAYIKAAASSARQANNQLRYDETCTLYEKVCAQWGQDYEVRALEELFVR